MGRATKSFFALVGSRCLSFATANVQKGANKEKQTSKRYSPIISDPFPAFRNE